MRDPRHMLVEPTSTPSPERLEVVRGRIRESTLLEGLLVSGLVALISSFAAVLGNSGCGSTDGSFSVDEPAARPSSFCQATHFPGLPDALGSWAFVAIIYLTPVAFAAAGTIAAAATGERKFLRLGLGIAAGLTLAALIASIALARVGFAGYG